MIISSNTYAALSCAAALTLAGCGHSDDIDLLGVKLGMTHDEVKSATPSGSALYCRGDGDTAFDQAHLSESTSRKFCAWTSVDSSGKRSFSKIEIGNAASSEQLLAFDYSDGTLKTFTVEIPGNAYDGIVKDLSDKFRSPKVLPGLIRDAHWDVKDGTLTATTEDLRPSVTLLELQAATAPRS